jgi:hypothetical protein
MPHAPILYLKEKVKIELGFKRYVALLHMRFLVSSNKLILTRSRSSARILHCWGLNDGLIVKVVVGFDDGLIVGFVVRLNDGLYVGLLVELNVELIVGVVVGVDDG